MKKKKLMSGFAYDKKGSMARYFGVRGIPSSVLVDASGTIVYAGHPGKINDAMVEAALEGAISKPFWEWPKEASKVKKALLSNKLATALSEAQSLEGDYLQVVEAKIASVAAAPAAALERKDYLAAVELGEEAEKALKGLPQAEDVAKVVEQVLGDADAKRVLEGQKKLAKLIAKGRDVTSSKKLTKLIEDMEDLRSEYPGTILVEQAKTAADELRKKKNNR